jgi:cell wall-associated NlpC family hydrolase
MTNSMSARHDTTTQGRGRAWRRLIAAVVLAVALLACLAGLGGGRAVASPTVIVATRQPTSLTGLQQAADKVQRQVAALDDRLEIVIENWDESESRLTAIQGQLGQVRLQLTQSQTDLDRQQSVLGSHLAWMYKNGDYGLLDELLTNGSLTDAAARIELYKRVSQQDRQLRDDFLASVKKVGTLQASIAAKRNQAMVVQQQVDAERITIQDKLAERQAILDGLNGRIKKILNQRAQAAALASGRLGRAALAQIGRVNGTPAQTAVVRDALRFLGVPYVWGGATPSGFDCSGLVLYVYARYGVNFPHFAAYQAEMGMPVAESQLEPADLVFFGNPIHHVVIYAGAGLVVEAPHTGDVVKVARLSDFEAPTACRRYLLHLP